MITDQQIVVDDITVVHGLHDIPDLNLLCHIVICHIVQNIVPEGKDHRCKHITVIAGNDKSLIPIGQLHADSRLQNIDTLDQCGNDLLIVAIIRVQQCAYRFDLGCRLFLKVHCRHGIVCIRRL